MDKDILINLQEKSRRKNIIKRVPAGKYTYYVLLKYKSTAHFAGHLTGHREIKKT